MQAILHVMEERDRFEAIRNYLSRSAPEVIERGIVQGKMPKYALELLVVLARLYDAGYAHATKDLRELR
jgi:hypothetical protein